MRRVDKIADDLRWVELTVGGADLRTAGAVTVDVAFGGNSELVEEGVEKDVSLLPATLRFVGSRLCAAFGKLAKPGPADGPL